jgi:hypothetical protein
MDRLRITSAPVLEVVAMEFSTTDDRIDRAPVQDRDLLQRLSLYFDAIDHRLEQGQGWFIFNAGQPRAHRISGFIHQRASTHTPPLRTYFVPWRDFALSAFVNEIGLAQIEQEADRAGDAPRLRQELSLAKNVTDSAVGRMLAAELVVLTGLKPTAWHEATFLDRMIEARYQQRQATILLTPDTPGALEDDFKQVDPSSTFWERLYTRMYETSLVAL